MKKLKYPVVSTTVISALILSNAITGASYAKDHEIYESKLNNQSQVIKHYKKLIKQNDKEIDKNLIKISKYKTDVNNLDKELDKVKKENAKLKRLINGKGVNSGQTFIVTYYTCGYESTQKHPGDIGYGLTASGTVATEGRTIAAPQSIPFGTKVYIEGLGIRIVEDRGNAIYGNHIDVYVENVDKALRLGRQELKVKIID